jgi:hypothetical protein
MAKGEVEHIRLLQFKLSNNRQRDGIGYINIRRHKLINYVIHIFTRGKLFYGRGKMSTTNETENKCVLYCIKTREKSSLIAKATQIRSLNTREEKF